LLALLSLAQLMVILDVSAVNVALPDMAKDLNLSGGQLGWTITSYSLVFGSLLLLGGRAADLLGRRRMFLAGLGVFTASSLASALSAGAGAFFAARAGQGLGAAMLSPAALSIITTTFQGPQRTKALGVWGAVGGAGAAIGVLLGGMLTELIDWRAIFFINLPVSAGVLIAARRAIAPDREPPRWSGLDLRGALLATASLAAVVYALSQSGDAGWTSAQTLVLGLGGLTGLALFGALETRTRTPLLNVSRLGVDGSYVPDVLPGMVIAGLGLGIALVGVALSVLTGAPAEEAGMLSGLNTTGHEVGGSIGIAVLVSVATGSAAASPTALAGGIGDAFLVASIIATVGGIVGPLLLPTTRTFLPKLKAAPPVSVH